ncbi:unnamed protein product [Trichobilharzia szidati]|nr:unnamed protein product [Trichobilharzia szidati]
MFGEDFCAFLHDTWQCKAADGVLSSAHLKLFHRWSNGILLTNKENNVRQNSIHHSIHPFENGENLFKISNLKSSAPINMTSSDCIPTGAHVIRYEDVCQLLSKSTFIQLAGHFEKISNKPEKDVHVIHQAAEEILKNVVSRINTSSVRGTIFKYFFLEKSSTRELSQNRPLICLMELLKKFIRTSDLNVILRSLEIATLLTQSLQCAGSESDNELMNRDFTLSFSDSEWFTLQLLNIICFALSDSNLVVRVAGTKLSLAAGSLPFSAMIIVRELAGGVLTYHNEYNTEEPKHEVEFSNYEFPVSKVDLLHKEAVDLITTLLLTFPSSEFDLAEVCKLVILPGLTDLKLQVRIATLDCIAVVAHLLGAGNLDCLLAAVSRADNFLLKTAGNFLQHSYLEKDGSQPTPKYSTLLEAVQRRLAKRQLPQLDSHSRVIRTSNNSVPGASILANTLGLSPNQGIDYTQLKLCIPTSGSVTPATPGTVTSEFKSSRLSASANQLDILSNFSTVQKVKYNYRRRPSAGLTRRQNQLPWDPRISIDLSSSYPGKISSRLIRRNSNCNLFNTTDTHTTSSTTSTTTTTTITATTSSTEVNHNSNHLRKTTENNDVLLTSNNSVVFDSTTNKHYNHDKYTDNHIADDSSDNNDDDYHMDTKSSTTHRNTTINGKHANPQQTTNHSQQQEQQQQQQENSNRTVNPTSNSQFNNHIKSDFMNLSSTKRYSSKTQFSEFGSQSLPASGRLSPTLKSISDQSTFEQSRLFPLRSSLIMAKSTSNSDEPSSFTTPRRRPRLAPIRHPSSGNQSDHSTPWTAQDQSVQNSNLISTYPSSLLPTRATLGRQSGRSRPTLSQVFNTTATTEDYSERNRFVHNTITPNSVLTTDFNCHSSSRISPNRNVTTHNRNIKSDRTASYNKLDYCTTTRTHTDSDSFHYYYNNDGDDDFDDNDVEEEIYDEDYESDEEYTDTGGADDGGGGDETTRTIDNGKFSQRNRSTKPSSLPASALPLKLDNNDTVLSNTTSSCEMPEVSSIRSAASHRRAMRLFEEAEKRRQSEISNNAQPITNSTTPISSLKVTKVSPTSLSNTCIHTSSTDINHANSNLSGPVLTPAVVPAMPLQRLIPGKASAKRRGNISINESVDNVYKSGGGGVGGDISTIGGENISPKTPTNYNKSEIDRKQSQLLQEQQLTKYSSSNTTTATTVSSKYNPYVGASFRENRDYAGLVIGRATGSPLPTTTTTTSGDMHQQYQSIERRPLKGQHNIQSTITNPSGSLNHLPSTDTTSQAPAGNTNSTGTPSSSTTTTTSFNVVGRSLFDQPLVTSGKSHIPQSSSSPSINKVVSGNNINSSGRQTPGNYKHTEHNQIDHNVYHASKDSELEGSNVLLGIGINEATYVASAPNVSDGDSKGTQETCVSLSFRQRILQKKSKKLQNLRDNSTLPKQQTPNTSPLTLHQLEINQNKANPETTTECTFNVDNEKSFSRLDSSEHPPSHSTWPPPSSNSSSRLNLSSKPEENSPNLKANITTGGSGVSTASSTRRRLPAENSLSRGSVNNTVINNSGNSNDPMHPMSHCTDTSVNSGDTSMKLSDYDKNPLPDKPLLKGGKSVASLSGTPPTLPSALNLVNSDDWEDKVSGLELLTQIFSEQSIHLVQTTQTGSASAGSSRQPATNISTSAPTLVITSETLSQTVQAVITECRNLRSQVSRQAVQTMGSLFQGLNRAMDPHVDVCIRVLLSKCGEAAAAFLRDEVTVIMDEVVQYASPSRTLQALIQHGLGIVIITSIGVGDLPPSASSSAGVRRRGFSPATRSRGPSAGGNISKV